MSDRLNSPMAAEGLNEGLAFSCVADQVRSRNCPRRRAEFAVLIRGQHGKPFQQFTWPIDKESRSVSSQPAARLDAAECYRHGPEHLTFVETIGQKPGRVQSLL